MEQERSKHSAELIKKHLQWLGLQKSSVLPLPLLGSPDPGGGRKRTSGYPVRENRLSRTSASAREHPSAEWVSSPQRKRAGHWKIRYDLSPFGALSCQRELGSFFYYFTQWPARQSLDLWGLQTLKLPIFFSKIEIAFEFSQDRSLRPALHLIASEAFIVIAAHKDTCEKYFANVPSPLTFPKT